MTPALIRLHLRLTTKATKSQKALSQNAGVLTTVKSEFSQPWLFGANTAEQYVDALVTSAQQDEGTVEERLSAARCKMLLEGNNEAGQAVANTLLGTDALWTSAGISVKNIERVVRIVSSTFQMRTLADQLIARVRGEYPLANFGALRTQQEPETNLDTALPEAEEVA